MIMGHDVHDGHGQRHRTSWRCEMGVLTQHQPWYMPFIGHHIYESHTTVAILAGLTVGTDTAIPFRSDN